MNAYDHDGNPITLDEWARLHADGNNIALTTLTDVVVSTVWLGFTEDDRWDALCQGLSIHADRWKRTRTAIALNPAQRPRKPPLIFETLVFPAKNGEITDAGELDCRRYSTLAEAEAGHAELVAEWAARTKASA